jgi:hypothetical protein
MAAAATLRAPVALALAAAVLMAATIAAVFARRWRVAALGAGGELRDHERARVLAWTALRAHLAHDQARERVYIATQGELVRERAWPAHVRGLPMTGDGRGLLPLEEGHHQLFVGATGSGKTTSARRVLLARGLSEPNVAILGRRREMRLGICRTLGRRSTLVSADCLADCTAPCAGVRSRRCRGCSRSPCGAPRSF